MGRDALQVINTTYNSNRIPNLTTPEQIMNKRQSKNGSSNLHELFMQHWNITYMKYIFKYQQIVNWIFYEEEKK